MESADPRQTISAPLAVPWATTNSTESDLALDRACHYQQRAEFKGCGIQYLKYNLTVIAKRMLFLRTSSISAVPHANHKSRVRTHRGLLDDDRLPTHLSHVQYDSTMTGCQHSCHMYSSSAGSKVLTIVQSSTCCTECMLELYTHTHGIYRLFRVLDCRFSLPRLTPIFSMPSKALGNSVNRSRPPLTMSSSVPPSSMRFLSKILVSKLAQRCTEGSTKNAVRVQKCRRLSAAQYRTADKIDPKRGSYTATILKLPNELNP